MVSKEKKQFREKVKSLSDKLAFTEQFPVLYSGGSPAFVQYSRIICGTYQIPMLERRGSIAALAKRELQMQIAKPEMPQWKRYCLGRALGFSAEQIHMMHKDIGKYFRVFQRELPSNKRSFEEDVKLRRDDLEYKKACQNFETIFPEEKASYFFAVSLEFNLWRNAYDVEVISQPYKDFSLRDPITKKILSICLII